MKYLNYLIFFVIVFVFIYIMYFFVVVQPQIRALRNKNNDEKGKKKGKKKEKKDKKYFNEIMIIEALYKVDASKIGYIKTLRILNFADAFVMAALITAVMPIKAAWLKLLIITIVIIPVILLLYYFIAKYIKHLERKYENV